MLENEVLEVVFQRQVFGRLMAAVAGVTRRLWRQTDELVVFQIAQLDVDAQQVGGDFRLSLRITARSTAFSSSRTLPGQE